MSATIEGTITFEEFKQMVADFFKRCEKAPAPTADQLHAGLRMIRIGYLSLDMSESMWQSSAFTALQMAEKKAFEITGEVL